MRTINRTVFGISKGNNIIRENPVAKPITSSNNTVGNRRVAQMPSKTSGNRVQIIDRSKSIQAALVKPTPKPKTVEKTVKKKSKKVTVKKEKEIIEPTLDIEKEPLKYRSESFGELIPIKYSYKTPRGRKYKELGFEVQDVARLYPELVIRDNTGKPIKVQYDCFIPLLVREVQALRERLQYLEQEF